MARRPLLLALALAGGSFLGAAFADDLDVSKLFDSAKSAFAEKRYGKCLHETQDILGEVGRLRADALKAVLPNAPEGWTAADAEVNLQGFAWIAAGIELKRRYTKGDETSADLDLWADASGFAQSMLAMMQNPAFVPGSKVVTIKGRRALYTYSKDDKSAKLTVQLNVPNSVLIVEAHGVGDKELSDTFPAGFDLDALEKAIAN